MKRGTPDKGNKNQKTLEWIEDNIKQELREGNALAIISPDTTDQSLPAKVERDGR